MKKKRLAFSLLELLIVMAILALIAVLTMPALSSAMQGYRITQGTQILLDQITLARQLALSKNRAVETRIYSYKDPSVPGSERFFRAVQNFELQDDGTAKPLAKMVRLPSETILDSSSSLSPLLSSSRSKQWTSTDTQTSLPEIGTAYDTRVIVFRPSGYTDIPANGQSWFITLHAANAGDNLSSLPKNFSIIQIDPWTGRTYVFRP